MGYYRPGLGSFSDYVMDPGVQDQILQQQGRPQQAVPQGLGSLQGTSPDLGAQEGLARNAQMTRDWLGSFRGQQQDQGDQDTVGMTLLDRALTGAESAKNAAAQLAIERMRARPESGDPKYGAVAAWRPGGPPAEKPAPPQDEQGPPVERQGPQSPPQQQGVPQGQGTLLSAERQTPVPQQGQPPEGQRAAPQGTPVSRGDTLEVQPLPERTFGQKVVLAFTTPQLQRDVYHRDWAMQSLNAAKDFQPKYDAAVRRGDFETAQSLLQQFQPYASRSPVGLDTYRKAIGYLTQRQDEQQDKNVAIDTMLNSDMVENPVLNRYLQTARKDPSIKLPTVMTTIPLIASEYHFADGYMIKTNKMGQEERIVLPQLSKASDFPKPLQDALAFQGIPAADYANARNVAAGYTSADPQARRMAQQLLDQWNQRVQPAVQGLIEQQVVPYDTAAKLGMTVGPGGAVRRAYGLEGPGAQPPSGQPGQPALPPGQPGQQPAGASPGGLNLTQGQQQTLQAGQAAAQKYGVPGHIVGGMLDAESSYGQNLRSPKGAMGPMQIMPATAVAIAAQHNDDYPNQPWTAGQILSDAPTNIEAGVYHMKQLLQYYNGDMTKALSAYNAGAGRVDAAQGNMQRLPQETQNYVQKVNATAAQFQQPPERFAGPGATAPPGAAQPSGQAPAQAPARTQQQEPSTEESLGWQPPPPPPGPDASPAERGAYERSMQSWQAGQTAAATNRAKYYSLHQEQAIRSYRFNPHNPSQVEVESGLTENEARQGGYRNVQDSTDLAKTLNMYQQVDRMSKVLSDIITYVGLPGENQGVWGRIADVATNILGKGISLPNPLTGKELFTVRGGGALDTNGRVYLNGLLSQFSQALAETAMNPSAKDNTEVAQVKNAIMSSVATPRSLLEAIASVRNGLLYRIQGELKAPPGGHAAPDTSWFQPPPAGASPSNPLQGVREQVGQTIQGAGQAVGQALTGPEAQANAARTRQQYEQATQQAVQGVGQVLQGAGTVPGRVWQGVRERAARNIGRRAVEAATVGYDPNQVGDESAWR